MISLLDGHGDTWTPNDEGTYDCRIQRSGLAGFLAGWTRHEIEAAFPPVIEIQEPQGTAVTDLEQAWEDAKADIPRHDAEFERENAGEPVITYPQEGQR